MYKGVNFEKLEFNSEKEEKDFEKYVALKGVYLHKQVYDVLLSYNPNSVTYSDLSGVICYDKRLRNKLYIYLATFEEKLRSDIFEKMDVDKKDVLYKGPKGLDNLKIDIKEKTNKEISNLYFSFQLDLGLTLELLDDNEVLTQIYGKKDEDLQQIKELRNKVMHHNVLILGTSVNKSESELNIKNLKKQIALLCKYLPNGYQEGFKTDISNLKNGIDLSDFFKDLYLENIEWNM